MTVTVFRVEARLISPAVGSSCQPVGFKWLVFNHWLLANDNWLVTSCCQPDIVLVTWLACLGLPTVITGCVVGFQLSAISWKNSDYLLPHLHLIISLRWKQKQQHTTCVDFDYDDNDYES